MRILFVLANLNHSAPNTVILNVLNTLPKGETADVLALQEKPGACAGDFRASKRVESVTGRSLAAALVLLFNRRRFSRYDAVHLNGYHPFIWGRAFALLYPRCTVVSTCHSVEDREAASHRWGILKRFKSAVRLSLNARLFYPSHDAVIAVSESVRRYLSQFPGVKTELVYNGVDYRQFPPLEKKRAAGAVQLVQVGHVNPLKNQLFSIRLVAYLKHRGVPVHLHIVGRVWDSDYEQSLRSYCREEGLDDEVTFHGEQSQGGVYAILQQCDLMLMPSKIEGFPLALLEGFYFELAAVVSSNGGLPEAIRGEENGMVIDIGSERDFERVFEMLKAKRYVGMGRAARRIALEHYSAEKMGRGYAEVFRKLRSRKELP